MADTSRLRGVRYGAGHAPGGQYSSQAMGPESVHVLAEAVQEAGPFSSAREETYMEPVYLTSKAGIVDYYKDTYGDRTGRGGWKDHLVKDLAALTGMKPKSLEKRFDPARLNNAETRNKAQYEALGKQLPPSAHIPKTRPRKPKRARVSFSIYFRISNSVKSVNQTVILSDAETSRLMEAGDFDAVLEAYALNNIDMLEELDIGMMDIEMID